MATRDIRTSTQDTICDVCGRTLLRGEHAESYLDGATRRDVCELCKDRALHEGWVRAGTVTGYGDGAAPVDRRRSFLQRLRGGTRSEDPSAAPGSPPTLRDELDDHAWSQEAAEPTSEPVAEFDDPAAPASPPARRRRESSRPRRQGRSTGRRATPDPVPAAPASEIREPRHVRAVPTSDEQKTISAAALFNESEHPRTVAGVARSLGAPAVHLGPLTTSPSGVGITVSWELCWYRYEVDLSDEVPSVRSAGQGYELSELDPGELEANAVADEHGRLLFA